MPRKTDTAVVSTIGIDTGKNALHMVGLDERAYPCRALPTALGVDA